MTSPSLADIAERSRQRRRLSRKRNPITTEKDLERLRREQPPNKGRDAASALAIGLKLLYGSDRCGGCGFRPKAPVCSGQFWGALATHKKTCVQRPTDVTIEREVFLFVFQLNTPEAVEWAEENVSPPAWLNHDGDALLCDSFICEERYARDITAGMLSARLRVE